jgi:PAS domain S-box-containing protein
LVTSLVLIGLALQLGVGVVLHDTGPVTSLEGNLAWAHQPLLLVLLLGLTVVGDLVSVRVRHGEESEELTLFEAAVVVVVLLLPANEALLVPVVASLLCSLVRRRELVKTVFNAANQAAATAVFVMVVHAISGPPTPTLHWRVVLALVIGTLAFTTVNLVGLSRVYRLLGDDPWTMVREGVRLSLVMALGMVALGGTAVTLAGAAPALLPFTVIPAVALTFAYRAAAQESEERQRSSRLLALSQVLAGRLESEDLVAAFLDLTRQAFGADRAIVVREDTAASGAVPTSVVDDREHGSDSRHADGVEQHLLLRSSREGVLALTGGLPEGWVRAVVAPLEADGRRLGAIILATRDRHNALGRRELTLLTPLASALAVALRGAAHVQRLTEETSKLKAVVDQSSDGILVLDGEGRVQLWSPALESLTGRTELVALGRPLGQLVATLDADGAPVDPFAAGQSSLTPAEPRGTVELTVLRDDGQQRVVRCAHAAAYDDEGRLVRDVVIVHDVTREREVERLKADFIATVSHELRTPITPIKGYADLLRRRGESMTPAKRLECLDVISSRTEHLARLVEDLLLASHISARAGAAAAKVEMGTADLGAVTSRACADFGDDGERVTLSVPPGEVTVACDPMRAVQILTNLVGNALKYSAPGTPVDVRLLVAGGRATVEVEDRGRGIPADQLERVFDKFHRVEDPMRMTTGGTGLGLYIARELAAAMGATLSCRSTLGVGSVFSVSLPVVPVPGAAPTVPGTGQPPFAVPGAAVPRMRRPRPASSADVVAPRQDTDAEAAATLTLG